MPGPSSKVRILILHVNRSSRSLTLGDIADGRDLLAFSLLLALRVAPACRRDVAEAPNRENRVAPVRKLCKIDGTLLKDAIDERCVHHHRRIRIDQPGAGWKQLFF